MPNLKTSYVKVKLGDPKALKVIRSHLKTSYVKVKP